MDSRKLKLLLNTLLILAFLLVARDYIAYKQKSRAYEGQVAELQAEIARLRKETDEVRVRVGKLETDLPTNEREARNRLKMLKPGEEVIDLSDTEPRATARPRR